MTKINLWAGETFEYDLAEGASLSVNGVELSAAMVTHVVEFGLRQMIRDAGAGAKEDTERNALADKKLTALTGGTLRAGTGGGKRVDPVERRARAIALLAVEAKATPLGWTRKKMQDYADALYTRDQADLLAQAKAELALAANAEDGLDLESLGL